MAPMTRRTTDNGEPGPDFIEFYRRRAEGGVGLVIAGAIYIAHPAAGDDPAAPRLDDDATTAAWRRVVEGVHHAGARIAAELWHIGIPTTKRPPASRPVRLIGPSGISSEGDEIAPPMSARDLEDVIAGFVKSARAAVDAGFDAIEIHAAHGYLLDQFLWERTNRRTDRYGGDAAKRAGFVAEVVRECRRAVGPRVPILLRLSQWKVADYAARIAVSSTELASVLDPLVDAGVDVFDCSTRRFWEPEFSGSDLNLAGWVRKLTGKPTITVGSIGLDVDVMESLKPNTTAPTRVSGRQTLQALMPMLARGDFDLVALARPLLADPDWPRKISQGALDSITPFERSHFKQMGRA